MVKGNTKQGNSNKKSSLISIASWILVLEHALECVRSTDFYSTRRPPPLSVVYAWPLRDYKKSSGEGEIITRNPTFYLSLSLFFKSQGKFYFTTILPFPCLSKLMNWFWVIEYRIKMLHPMLHPQIFSYPRILERLEGIPEDLWFRALLEIIWYAFCFFVEN